MNTFGFNFRLTTFGESHGEAMGGVIDGCPAGLEIDLEKIEVALARRRPGQSALTTSRQEEDKVQFLSGLLDCTTTGAPIAFIVANRDHHSQDYDHLKNIYRPSHADFTYHAKWGVRDYRGGGRASARETVVRVVAGAIAAQLIAQKGIEICAYTSSVGGIVLEPTYWDDVTCDVVNQNPVRCPDADIAHEMIKAIESARENKDSVGGTISCIVRGVPAGWGEPLYAKLHAMLGSAILSINACRGFEVGDGFTGVHQMGSCQNDSFITDKKGNIVTQSNHSGGIQGGLSNGSILRFRAAFRPTPSIGLPQQTVTVTGEPTTLELKGRHDPCVLPRAVPVVEAMTALVLADAWCMSQSSKI